jgi:selenide, water dikinase
MTPTPKRRLVLAGGGHSHLEVLRRLGRHPVEGLEIVLVAKELNAPYSGMLPGLIGGLYPFDACHVDLTLLARHAGVRVIHGTVDGIDLAARQVMISGEPPLGFDLLSLDVGITPAVAGIRGAAEHGIPVKPISSFYPVWRDLLARCLKPGGPRHIAIIGGGAAGYEIVHAVRRRILDDAKAAGLDPSTFSFTLISGGVLLPAANRLARHFARDELARAGVRVVEGDQVAEISAERLVLESGETVPCDAAILCTPGRAAPWFGETGLPLDEKGFFAVRPTLQSTGDDAIFAVGDCAGMIGQQRPKAGVFAVRQGPVLARNILRRLAERPLEVYRPQTRYLTLLANAQGSAIASRGPLAARGRLMLVWKDFIDRRFMRRYKDLG